MKLFNNKKGVAPLVIVAAILSVAIGLPILLLGMSAVTTVMKFMSSPVINGSIPVWAILIAAIAILIIYKKMKRY